MRPSEQQELAAPEVLLVMGALHRVQVELAEPQGSAAQVLDRKAARPEQQVLEQAAEAVLRVAAAALQQAQAPGATAVAAGAGVVAAQLSQRH